MHKLTPEQIQTTRSLFIDYVKGSSLSQIGMRLGLTKWCIQYRFQTYVHPNYHQLARKGTLAEMKRYLSSKHQSNRAKKEIQEWLVNELDRILEFENNRDVDFFTESKANQLTRRDLPFLDFYYTGD